MSNNSLEILIVARDLATATLKEAAENTGSLVDSFATLGSRLTASTAGISAALALSVNNARNFQAEMINTAAITGVTGEEFEKLSNQVLQMAENTAVGPQAVASAMYEIASGVADASTHFAILEQSVRTAEAGQADLMATTSSIISTMNAYGYSADQASRVSDILSQTVAVGVGSMQEFASALPNVTSLAADLGIGFENVGAAAAYMTTKGFTAAQASTRLNAALISMLNPNQKMKDVLQQLGYETGRAAIEQLGLEGALRAVAEVAGDNLTAALGSSEALMAVTVLATDEASLAFDNFAESIDGATERAREIQQTSLNYQLDIMKSKLSVLSIEIGRILIPALTAFVSQISTVLDATLNWVRENEEAFKSIVGVAVALAKIGPILIGVAAAISILISPTTWIITALTGLIAIFQTDFLGIKTIVKTVVDTISSSFSFAGQVLTTLYQTTGSLGETFLSFFKVVEDGSSFFTNFLQRLLGRNEGGQAPRWMTSISSFFYELPAMATRVGDLLITVFNDYIGPGISSALSLAFNTVLPGVVTLFTDVLMPVIQSFIDWVNSTGGDMVSSIFGSIVEFIQNELIPTFNNIVTSVGPIFQQLISVIGGVVDFVGNVILPRLVEFFTQYVIPVVSEFVDFIGSMWDAIRPGLEFMAAWFVENLLPALGGVFGAIFDALQPLVETLVGLWDVVRPHLENLANWFISDVLPVIAFTISEIVIPAIEEMIRIISGIWEFVGPALVSLADWFLNSALPFIVSIIENVVVPAIEFLVGVLQTIWTAVSPVIQGLVDWFTTTGWPIIEGIFNNVIKPAVDFVVGILKGIWELVEPTVQNMVTFFQNLGGVLETIWNEGVAPAVEVIKSIFEAGFTWIDQNVIQPFVAIFNGLGETLGTIWNEFVVPVVNTFKNAFESVFNWIDQNVIQPFISSIGGIVKIAEDVVNSVNSLFGRQEQNFVGQSAASILAPSNFANIRRPLRDTGGFGFANTPYSIGSSQTNQEIFVPRTSGDFIADFFERVENSTRGSGQIIVNINGGDFGTPQARQRNAEDFAVRLQDEIKKGGFR